MSAQCPGCPKADMAGRFTREELQTAIEKVGNSAASVRKELGRQIVIGDTLVLPGRLRGRACRAKPFENTCNRRRLMVPQEGFEPPTPSLRMMCSTG